MGEGVRSKPAQIVSHTGLQLIRFHYHFSLSAPLDLPILGPEFLGIPISRLALPPPQHILGCKPFPLFYLSTRSHLLVFQKFTEGCCRLLNTPPHPLPLLIAILSLFLLLHQLFWLSRVLGGVGAKLNGQPFLNFLAISFMWRSRWTFFVTVFCREQEGTQSLMPWSKTYAYFQLMCIFFQQEDLSKECVT